MSPATRRNIAAGAVIGLLGVIVIYAASGLALGDALRMGPGYIPRALGFLLVFLGLLVAVIPLIASEGDEDGAEETVSLRALLIVAGSPLLFAMLIKTAGLAITSLACVLFAGLARRETRWVNQLALAAAASVVCVLVFVMALGLPVPIWPTL